jgi:hypothetical protein
MGIGSTFWKRLAGAILAAGLLVGCGTVTGVEDPSTSARVETSDDDGAVVIRIALGSVALAKKADTNITLDTLHLTLTAAGCPTRTVNLPVSGNINTSGLVLTTKVTGLNPLRNWKLKAFSRDLADTVMHIDSTTFYVKPADTANVSLTLVPKYSVLVARFISTSNSVTAIQKLILRVNGVVVDDTTFSAKQRIFDLKLSHKYIKAGANTTIKLEALDRASPARIKYSKQFTLNPRATGDSTLTVNLN